MVVSKVIYFIYVIDGSVISNLGKLKLSGQEEGMKSLPKTAKVCHDKEDSDSELSSESDKSDINDQEHCGAIGQSNKVEAPVELKGEVCQCSNICTWLQHVWSNVKLTLN